MDGQKQAEVNDGLDIEKQVTEKQVTEEIDLLKSSAKASDVLSISSSSTNSSEPPTAPQPSKSTIRPISHIPDEPYSKPSTRQKVTAALPLSAASATLDKLFPPNRKYFGFSRKIALLGLVAMVSIIVLIIGLAAGLTGRG